MSYQDYEDGLEIGSPVELYEFTQGAERWFYISGNTSIIRLAQVYEPSSIKRDRIKQTNDVLKDSLKLKFPRSNEFANQFIGAVPDVVTSATVLRGHWGDPDEEYEVSWKGRVIGSRADENAISLECESVFTSIKRPGLRARFEINCRHVLYGAQCGVNQNVYRHDGTVLSINNSVDIEVTNASLFANGYFTGGKLVNDLGVARFIIAHSGNVVTLARPLASLGLSDDVAIYPGCDHAKTTCFNKFGNLPRFGGFPYIPERNPFDGNSIV